MTGPFSVRVTPFPDEGSVPDFLLLFFLEVSQEKEGTDSRSVAINNSFSSKRSQCMRRVLQQNVEKRRREFHMPVGVAYFLIEFEALFSIQDQITGSSGSKFNEN